MAFTGKEDKALSRDISNMIRNAPGGLLPMTEVGELVLRKESAPYNGEINEKIFKKLIEIMRVTMLKAPGVGLAAPQVGLGLAFAVVEDHPPLTESGEIVEAIAKDPREFAEFPFHVIINPHYEPIGDKTASFYEGCLSVPGYEAVRKRWLDIKATWQDENGDEHEENLHGWPARIFQHETDHLSGEVYIDKCEIRTLATTDNITVELEENWEELLEGGSARPINKK